MENHNQTYEISQAIVARRIAQELLLFPVKENFGDLSCLFSINETGSRIWDLLVQKQSFDQIVQTLLDEYEIDRAKLEEDTQRFLGQLAEIGTITPRPLNL